MNKQIDMLAQLPENKNISLPGSTSKKEGGSNFEDQERVHALVASNVRYTSFMVDSRASRNMVSTKDPLSSLYDSKGPNILLGDNLETYNKGKGSIDFDHGSFNNVLYVPSLTTNLLSVYHMSHNGSHKKVAFTPMDVEI